jgi:cell division protein FtsB
MREEPGDPVDRFRTKRSVRIGGGKGSREYSLRLLAIALFAILAVIIVTPTFSHYLARQQELSETRADLVDTQARVKELQHELDLWNDDDYVRTQARERLGYVTPGETLYVVADPSEGSAQDRLQEKIDKVNRDRRAATPWYVTLSDSISVAGQSGDVDDTDETPIIQPVKTATPSSTASSPKASTASSSK